MATLIMEVKIEPVMDMHPTSDGMVSDILSQMETLEPRRKYMFITWLHAHNSKMKNAKNVREGLSVWFDSMPCENAQWEYRLIKDEIGWWRNQNEPKVDLLMIDHFAERDA
jgi:hypothetical protein